jgi:hypothetical protein
MEYICDKRIYSSQSLKNCIYTSKLGLWMEFLGQIFNGLWYWYMSIKSRTISKLKIFGWNFIQKMWVFFAFLSNKCIIISIFRKNPLRYEKGGDFMDGDGIIFLVFVCLVMFHELHKWGPMVIKNNISYILYVH